MKILLLTLLAVSSTASSAFAQPALPTCKARDPSAAAPAQVTPRTYQEHWCDRVLEIAGLRSRAAKTGPQLGVADEISNLVNVRDNNWRAFLLYVQARSSMVDASPVEDARVDKQVGAPAGAGSTSLVSKGSVPGILGFAVENGALTQTTSSTTVTLRGNLVGWLDLLKNQAFILSYQDGSGFVRTLRRVSYSLTLNTDTGASAAEPAPSGPAALTPQAIRAQLDRTKQQLAGYSVRVAIVDQRDPRTAANRASIATLADTDLVDLLKSNRAFDDFLDSAEYSEKWLQDAADQLSDPTTPLSVVQIQRILYQRLEALRLLMINRIDNFEDEVARNLLALNAYDKARRRLFETIRKRPLFAFEYVNAKTNDLPDSSTVRFIAEGQWGSRVDLTANAAMTFQHAGTVPLPEPKDIGGRRDFQLAGQMDVPLGSLEKRVSAGTGVGAPVVGVGFLAQNVTDRAAVSFGGNRFTVDSGLIAAVQGKVTVSVKGSGVKIPLSISYANRTEMLKEKDVRGHIGVTFDMDVLSSVVRR
jgi:hypothetical protein